MDDEITEYILLYRHYCGTFIYLSVYLINIWHSGCDQWLISNSELSAEIVKVHMMSVINVSATQRLVCFEG